MSKVGSERGLYSSEKYDAHSSVMPLEFFSH